MSNVLSPCLFELSQSYKLNICYKTHLLLPHYLSLLCDKHPDSDTELLQHNPGLLSALGTQHAALQQLLRSSILSAASVLNIEATIIISLLYR